MMSDVSMPLSAIRMQIGSGIDAVVQVSRLADGTRKITHITEVVGFDLDTGKYETFDLFERRFTGMDAHGKVLGDLQRTSRIPGFVPRLHEHGVVLPTSFTQSEARS
jgi:pilus assembly protein CpaF